MNRQDVAELFSQIKMRYDNFMISKEKCAVWFEDLKHVPYEVALENLRRHAGSEKFPPTIAELSRSLEPAVEQSALYHNGLRESAKEYFAQLDEFQRTAVPPPDEIRAIMRLPKEERAEALSAYAKRHHNG